MEQFSFFHKIHQIDVADTVALLEQVVGGNDKAGIVVFDAFQRAVFPVLRFFTCRDGIRHLHIGVPRLRIP